MSMWKKIFPLAIVASLAMNVAVAGLWTARAFMEWRGLKERPGVEAAGGPVWCPLHRRLNVTEEQWRALEPRMKRFRSESMALCDEISRKRTGMLDLISSPRSDRKAVEMLQEDILAGQKRMQDLVIDQLLDEKKVLSDRQIKELFDLLRSSSNKCNHPMMDIAGAKPCADRDAGGN